MLWSDNNNPREDSVFTRVKAAARGENGPGSVVKALRHFRELDDEMHRRGEKGLTHKIFIDFLRDLGFSFGEGEAEYLCAAFDDDNDGYITSSRFVRHFIGLNARRHKAIVRAWEVLPKNEQGNVALNDLYERFARCGTSEKFSSTFSTPFMLRDDGKDGNNDSNCGGWVSFEEFLAFYAAVSPEIAFDEQFELYLLREWDADAPTRPTMDETQREWGIEGDPLEITGPLLVQDALKMSLGVSSRHYNTSHMQRVHPPIEPLQPLERDYLSTMKRDFRRFYQDERLAANTLRHRY